MRGAAALALLLLGGTVAAEAPSQADWAGARQEATTADGQRLTYVEVEGATDTPADAPPVILIHGSTDNSRSWSLLAPHLPGRQLLMLDLRGHGGSAAPPCCYGLDALAHDVVGFMDAMGVERTDLVGHSLGSMTAGVVAALHPERVGKLVLVSTAMATPRAGADWLWTNVGALEAPIDPDSQFMLDWYWKPTPVDEDFLSRERAESAAVPLHVWTGVLHALTLTDWTPLAARIEAPTLVLWGDGDTLFDASAQDAVRAALPQARHETYAGHGHNLFWEVPEAAGARITAFLGQ